jgi:hypothetical protein
VPLESLAHFSLSLVDSSIKEIIALSGCTIHAMTPESYTTMAGLLSSLFLLVFVY